MSRILKPLAGIFFAGFLIGMFLLVISLTYSALGRIFPDNFINQVAGLVLFDIAALVWGLAFVYHCESTAQYAIAAIGFLTGLIGTFLMISIEVFLSAQELTHAPDELGQTIAYTFIAASGLHLTLGYAHKATAPDVDASIRLGAAQAGITSEAIAQAERALEENRVALSGMIAPRLTGSVRRSLSLPVTDEEFSALEIIDAKPKNETTEKIKGLPLSEWWSALTGKPQEAHVYEQRIKDATQEAAGETPASFPDQEKKE